MAQGDIREKTRAWYRHFLNSHLLPVFRDAKVSQIDRARILAHFDQRRKSGASPGNLGRDLLVLKAVHSWAKEHGYQTDDSAWKVRKPRSTPRVTRRFDPDEIERLLSAATGRDRAVLEVRVRAGITTHFSSRPCIPPGSVGRRLSTTRY